MRWFTKLCRNTGLMIHHIKSPGGGRSRTKVLSRTVVEKKLDQTTILRRTTIDEVEVKQNGTSKRR